MALGYRIKSDLSNNAGMRNTTDIECEYINTIHSLLYTPIADLPMLLEAVLLHLLSRPMFVPGNHGCFLQVAGAFINESSTSKLAPGRFHAEQNLFHPAANLNAAMKLAAESTCRSLRHPRLCPCKCVPTRRCHFDLFYKHSYHKVNRLSLNKTTTVAPALWQTSSAMSWLRTKMRGKANCACSRRIAEQYGPMRLP